MCLKKKEATVSRATTSNLLNSRDRGTVVPNPCQAEVGIHFHHPDVSVLGRHRMTVSSAEVQASWETAKAVYVAAAPAPVMQSMCNTGAAFGGAAAIPATLDGAAGTVGPASAEAAAKEPTEVEPYQLLNFLECEMMHFYDG
ncbi:uncharacterized protein ISCGN_013514 [Ixodes scapularis]